ncbi:MAG: hypothetical protein JF588_21230 [Caulobacterales bacterium]|nr:hypothetical protein [Caulobacterales bacterium]
MSKKRKDLFPKKIAGVKVPKSVRRGRFGEFLASPTGQAMIAQAVVGAGAVAAGLKAKDSPKVRKLAHDAKHKVADSAGDAADNAGEATSSLAFALGEAARSFADAIRRSDRHDSAVPGAAEADGDWSGHYGAQGRVETPAKKQSPAQPAAPR